MSKAAVQDEKLPKKVQFSFTPATLEVIENLQSLTNASSMAEVIRNALFIYNWAVQTSVSGIEIYTITPEGVPNKVILPNVTNRVVMTGNVSGASHRSKKEVTNLLGKTPKTAVASQY